MDYLIREDTVTEQTSPPTILIAEDEQSLAGLYKTWLEPDYTVKSVNDGAEAVAVIDETIDVVLLDRQMPELSGDEVIEALNDQEHNCRIAMVTAVEPDFDILDFGCDDYLTKPVSREELCGTVERLMKRDSYDEQLQAYFALISKKAVLEKQKSADELADSQKYETLVEKIAQKRERLDDTIATFGGDEFIDLFRDLNGSTLPSQTNHRQG